MGHWRYPANIKYYDVVGAFAQKKTYCPVNSKVAVDDIIYFYLSAPYKQIGFVCRVLEVDMDERLIIDKLRPFFKGKVDGKNNRSYS